MKVLRPVDNNQDTDDEVEFEDEEDEPSKSLINSAVKIKSSSMFFTTTSKYQNVITHNVDDELFKSQYD